MAVSDIVSATLDPNDQKTKPLATTGKWGWGPVSFDWTFTFATQFFDADISILGVKVVTVVFDSNGVGTVDIGAFGWDIDGTLTLDIPNKDVTADLKILEGGTVKFDHTFVIFTWR